MPFFGSDWRAPGDKWIRTEFGWKRLSDIHSTLQRQIGKVACSVMAPAAAAVKRSAFIALGSQSGSPGNSTCSSSRASSRASSPDRGKGNYSTAKSASVTTFDERRLKLCLAQRCISARGSSRESNQYATVSDAINKLNFGQALLDTNCYPFICKVIERLYEDHYWTLGGSMQTTLLRLTNAAKDIAIESRQHTGYIMSLMEKQIFTLEKGRGKMMTGFTVSRLDVKIKNVLISRAQLVGELQRIKSVKVSYLPDDCWRLVISFLDQPRDVLSLGCVNSTLNSLTSESSVWRSLTEYHYGRNVPVVFQHETKAMDIFKEVYWASRKELTKQVSYAITLCKVCNCVYWRDYGHPCTTLVPKSPQPFTTSVGRSQALCSGLTSQQFIDLFQC